MVEAKIKGVDMLPSKSRCHQGMGQERLLRKRWQDATFEGRSRS
jgi:hypothetical protein